MPLKFSAYSAEESSGKLIRRVLPKISSNLPFLFLATRVLSLGFQNPTANESVSDSIQRQQSSIEQQRRSVSQQVGTQSSFRFYDSTFFTQNAPPPVSSEDNVCASLPPRDLDRIIQDAARKHHLEAPLIKAVIKQESDFDPCAVSSKGAQGLMQLMPATAQELQVSDPFDPKENIEAGSAYLRQMLDRYKGDLRLALVAYNAGPSRADPPKTASDSTVPIPRETQDYIAGIFAEFGLNQFDRPQQPNPADGNALATEMPMSDLPLGITPTRAFPRIILPPSALTLP